MPTKTRPTRQYKALKTFRLHPARWETIRSTAAKMRRTQESVLDQLISQYCTTKNLQP
jgi:hypothetical protein